MRTFGVSPGHPAWLLTLAAICILALMQWQGSAGFNLADEGYLWYGVQRVMKGEVPLRDFMSYEPGRYYWSAALMSLWGDDGIMSLRWAVALFQGAGLFAALLLIARCARTQALPFILLSAVILAAWMFPRHKLFDISLSILLVAALAFLIRKPTVKRYFLAGLWIGLTAVFGRNHGLYGAVAGIGALIWLQLRGAEGPGLVKAGAYAAAGVALGFLPVLLMAALVPGFAAALWDSVRFLFEIKSTNLPVPVPWPWRVDFAAMPLGTAIGRVLLGFGFVGVVAFGAIGLPWIVWRRRRGEAVAPGVAAAVILALPYAHFAYSRADINHLAQGIFPTLIGCLALLAAAPARVKWPLAAALAGASLWVMHPVHPGWQCRAAMSCVAISVSGDTLRVDPNTAGDVTLLQDLAARYAPAGETLLAAPLWPGAYALLGRKAPVWEIYPLFPRPADFEQAEIRRIEAARPAFVVIVDFPLDGRDELRFRNTHPLLFGYVEAHFDRVQESQNPAYLVYAGRKAAQ